jgi:ATP-dependent RNA helicase RhlE
MAPNKLAEFLTKSDIPALAIHGNKSQSARTQALAKFKTGDLQVLVATDIAARGIDISELPHVVNFELPNVPEDYVHRIGRTGRAGAEGDAVSLVCVDEVKLLSAIERLVKHELPNRVVAGFEPDPRIKAEPITNGRGREPRTASAAPSRNLPKSRSGNKQSAPKQVSAGVAQPSRRRFSEPRRATGRGSSHAV